MVLQQAPFLPATPSLSRPLLAHLHIEESLISTYLGCCLVRKEKTWIRSLTSLCDDDEKFAICGGRSREADKDRGDDSKDSPKGQYQDQGSPTHLLNTELIFPPQRYIYVVGVATSNKTFKLAGHVLGTSQYDDIKELRTTTTFT